MKKILGAIAGTVMSAALFSGASNAAVIDFETTDTIPGITTHNIHVTTGSNHSGTGYDNGVISGTKVGYNGWGNPAWYQAVSGTFDFNSVWITAAWYNNLNVTITGSNGGSTLFSQVVTVSTDSPTYFSFNWMGLDKLHFATSGGVSAGLGGCCTHIALDDLTLNEKPKGTNGGADPLPEPSPLGMIFGAGLIALGIRYRKNRT